MDVSEAIETRIEVRDYTDRSVDAATRRAILDAGRLAPSGRNLQHWRFVLVDDGLQDLANASPTGSWVAGADFAIAVVTNPDYDFHEIDAGRAVTHMQLTAWERGIGSCIYTVDTPEAGDALAVPDTQEVTLVAGFGYPEEEVQGRKRRKSIDEIAFAERFGEPYATDG